MPALSDLQSRLGRRRLGLADAALAALVIAVVGLMIVPLPPWLLDLLIAGNLAVSIAVLLVALYVGNALKISAFPTLLLITTLLRLALNVSSTRLILGHAYAGEVIQSFGHFVVRSNYVVGGVIFLILALIQFIVIAKGSERVAEVGARFTLDAMPGKQLGIDAELRSGGIDATEAGRRRHELHRESQFYGAMDGAMKFVKGDVIASFLITLINILGGLAIGIGQRGMEPAVALKRYGLLTIGDGLVTQIPALVIATAAGILVTRVASEEADAPLGEELAIQVFGAPRPLRVASLFVGLLALVPGLPSLPFLVIGALLFVASLAASRPALDRVQPLPDTADGRRFAPVVLPWSLTLGSGLHPHREPLARATEDSRAALFQALGVPLPPCTVRIDRALPARSFALSLHELPALESSLPDGLDGPDVVTRVEQALLPALRARAADFLGIAETQALLDSLSQVSAPTVRQVVPKPVSVPLLADVLRRLVEEGISVRDLRAILEALAPVAAGESDPLRLAEHVRSQLRRSITHSLTGGRGELPVYLLDAPLEDTVREAISRTPAGSFLALAPAAGRDIVQAIGRALAAAAPPAGTEPVLLTQPDVRRFVRKLVENDLPELRVISHADLLPETSIQPIGKASLAGL